MITKAVSFHNINLSNTSYLSEDIHSVTENSQLSKFGNHVNEVICGNDDIYIVEIDKQKLIEKIVNLQKSIAKQNEKIDFLQGKLNFLIIISFGITFN